MSAPSPRPYDEALLRRTFDVASRSRAAGDHPFGCLLADARRPPTSGNATAMAGSAPQ
ncbi:MAG: hypothetical protein WCF81_09280 [Roseiarcus sp.]